MSVSCRIPAVYDLFSPLILSHAVVGTLITRPVPTENTSRRSTMCWHVHILALSRTARGRDPASTRNDGAAPYSLKRPGAFHSRLVKSVAWRGEAQLAANSHFLIWAGNKGEARCWRSSVPTSVACLLQMCSGSFFYKLLCQLES